MADADADHDLVVAELGRLDRQPHAVGETHQGDAEIGDGLLLGHLAGRAEVLVRPGHRQVDLRRLHRRGLGHLEGLAQGGLAAVDRVGAGHEHQRPGAREGLFQGRADRFGLQPLHLLFEQSQVLGRAGDHLVVVEGLGDLIGQLRGLAGRSLGHRGLQQHTPLGNLAVELGLGDAELNDTAHLGVGGGQGRLPFAGLGREIDCGLLGGVQIVALASLGRDERRVVGPVELLQPPVQHRQAQLLDLLALALGLAVRRRVVRLQPLDLDAEWGARLDGQPALGAALGGRAQVGIGPRRSLALPVREVGLDLGLHLDRVEVADGDQRRALGAVELAVVVGDQVVTGGPDHRHQPDRQPV